MQTVVSVIIVSWNTRDILLECLASLYAQTSAAMQVIVVDNDSADGSADAVAAAFPKVELIRSDENLGFARANNRGLALATGEYVLYLNPDTIILDAAVDRMLHFMRNHPQIGVLGPHTYNADGKTTQHTVKFNPTLKRVFHAQLPFWKLIPGWVPEQAGEVLWHRTGPVEVVKGSCMMVPTSLARRLNGMTERRFMYAEEDDLCERTRAAGLEVWYFADAHIIHLGGEATRQNSDEMVRAVAEAGTELFHRHNPGVSYQVFRRLMLAGSSLRWLAWSCISLLPSKRETALFKKQEHTVTLRHFSEKRDY